jgi:hypothetical protein
MAQFLWIEDFDNNSEASATDVFGPILPGVQLPARKPALKKALREHGIFLELNFLDGLRFIQDASQLARIDYILLDIDLPPKGSKEADEQAPLLLDILTRYGYDKTAQNQDKALNEAEKQLRPVAGYQLYIELVVNQGFPREHIVFCTNHGDQQKNYREPFDQAKIALPDIYTKSPRENPVSDWIVPRHQNRYTTLRRGIHEGCRAILETLSADTIRFTQFIDTDKRDITVSDMQAYLETLQKLLPLREPGETEKRKLFKLLLRTLVHEWDAKDTKKFDNDYIGIFCRILTHTRNWASHSDVLDDVTEEDLAFLFIAAMRTMFQLGSTQPTLHEGMLLKLFKATDNQEMCRKIGKSCTDTELPLAQTYFDLKNEVIKTAGVRDALRFSDLLNNLHTGGERNFNYIDGLYQLFWHGLSPVRSFHGGTRIDDKQNVCFCYSFRLNDYGCKDRGSFLFEFSRHIYQRSFKDYL